MRRFIAFTAAVLLASVASAETITVAAAISLKEAMAKVAAQFADETGDKVQFTLGSSGQLAQQITNGAPIDAFVSAANKQVDDLAKAGLVDGAARRVVAGNALVLIVPGGATWTPDSTKALADERATKIAIGEPKSVPAGQYAQQALKAAGLTSAVADKLVFGTNVRQVLDYVARGEVSAGLVYASDAKEAGDKVRIACEVAEGDHEPIVYPAVLVKASAKQATAARFIDYVLSEKGQATLKTFGFTAPPVAAK